MTNADCAVKTSLELQIKYYQCLINVDVISCAKKHSRWSLWKCRCCRWWIWRKVSFLRMSHSTEPRSRTTWQEQVRSRCRHHRPVKKWSKHCVIEDWGKTGLSWKWNPILLSPGLIRALINRLHQARAWYLKLSSLSTSLDFLEYCNNLIISIVCPRVLKRIAIKLTLRLFISRRFVNRQLVYFRNNNSNNNHNNNLIILARYPTPYSSSLPPVCSVMLGFRN